MNTDITASAKPEYPVIDRNPPFTKTVANFNTLDYLRLSTITGVSVVVGYLSGIKPGIKGPSMVTGGLIGVMGGFMLPSDALSSLYLWSSPFKITLKIQLSFVQLVLLLLWAGIEFSKRIVAQRKCKVCKGSGLVLRDKKYYFRCPGCGGFLPWQSWRRFFTG
ncbi:hypothetical protein DH2020_016909 [Rehmannia glutinosa]|uniref:NADH-ubiquinone oxidoreductase 21kDa subunit N-terminal domain-containing protein n=1 Tax=Rehmannia glutinosa TaxID=99300 RepID=A0ABR0WSV2_REHGL